MEVELWSAASGIATARGCPQKMVVQSSSTTFPLLTFLDMARVGLGMTTAGLFPLEGGLAVVAVVVVEAKGGKLSSAKVTSSTAGTGSALMPQTESTVGRNCRIRSLVV